jgi:hypothetical protein
MINTGRYCVATGRAAIIALVFLTVSIAKTPSAAKWLIYRS